MKAYIVINEVTRRTPDLPVGRWWNVAVEVRRDEQSLNTQVAVTQHGGPSDFRTLMVILPTDQPDWVCWASVEQTIRSFFANQVQTEVMKPDGSVLDLKSLETQLEDDYYADTEPWTYFGTTVRQLPSGSRT